MQWLSTKAPSLETLFIRIMWGRDKTYNLYHVRATLQVRSGAQIYVDNSGFRICLAPPSSCPLPFEEPSIGTLSFLFEAVVRTMFIIFILYLGGGSIFHMSTRRIPCLLCSENHSFFMILLSPQSWFPHRGNCFTGSSSLMTFASYFSLLVRRSHFRFFESVRLST